MFEKLRMKKKNKQIVEFHYKVQMIKEQTHEILKNVRNIPSEFWFSILI